MEFKEYLMEDALAAIIDYRGKTPQKSESGVPTLSAKSVKNNYINYAECYYISEAEYKRFMVRGFPQKGDILITTEAPMGMVARLDREDIAIAQRLLTLRGKEGVLDNDYLLYLLQSPYGQGLLKAKETGTTVTGIKQSEFRRIVIKLPDFAVQKKVSSVLNAIDSKILCHAKINDNLLAQAQAIFMQRFIMDKIEGDEKPLYDFADYINGAAFKPSECGDHGLPIIKIVELKNGITDSTKYFDGFKGEKYLIQDKDILFSWSGNPDTSIDIFIWTHGKAILNQHTFNVKSNTGHRWFTFLMLKYFKPEFSRIASNKQTTGLGHVTATDLKRLTFVFNKDAIEAFEHEVNPFMETIYSNMMENNRLEQLRDNLLPKLMSGEIDVSDIQL